MTKRKGVWGINQVRMKRVDDIWEQQTWNYGLGQRGKGQIGEPGCGNPYGVAGRIMTYPAPFDYAGSGTKWKRLSSATDSYTFSIWDQDDNMYVYGNNDYKGVLGMNKSTGGNYEGPGAMICTPTLLPAGSGRTWAHAHYTGGGVWAVKDNGELWGWGSNEVGQLGLNTGGSNIKYSSPVQIGTDTTWSSAYGSIKTVGSGSNARGVFAMKTDGTLWSWGYNYQGWLGLNQASTHKSSPTQIGTETTWSHIGEGGKSAIKTDGTLWVWGWNATGALGLNTQGTGAPYYGTQYPQSRSSPTQLGTSSDWVLVGGHMGYGGRAGNSKGEIWSWGAQSGSSFGLSYNDTTQYSSPVMATGTGSEFKFSNEDNSFGSGYGSWNGLVNKIPATDL